MSGTLEWRPVQNNWNHGAKGKMRDLIVDSGEEFLDRTHLEWLRGLLDAEIDGAERLIKAINTHNKIDVRISY